MDGNLLATWGGFFLKVLQAAAAGGEGGPCYWVPSESCWEMGRDWAEHKPLSRCNNSMADCSSGKQRGEECLKHTEFTWRRFVRTVSKLCVPLVCLQIHTQRDGEEQVGRIPHQVLCLFLSLRLSPHSHMDS